MKEREFGKLVLFFVFGWKRLVGRKGIVGFYFNDFELFRFYKVFFKIWWFYELMLFVGS